MDRTGLVPGALFVIALIALGAVLRLAAVILVPLVIAVLLAVVLAPFLETLE